MGNPSAVVAVLAIAACGTDKPAPLSVRAKVRQWLSGDPCSQGTLIIDVNTEDEAVVRVLDVEEKAGISYTEIELDAAKVGDRKSLPVTATLGNRTGEDSVDVPKPPPRRGKIEQGSRFSSSAWNGKAVITYGGDSPYETTIDVNGQIEDGRLVFPYGGCLLAGGESTVGDFEVRSPNELVHRVPLDAALAGTPAGDGTLAFPIALTIINTDGVRAQLKLDGTIDPEEVARLVFQPTRAGTGVASAPAYEPGKKQAFAQFATRGPSVHRGGLRDVAVVAWSEGEDEREVAQCGPYAPRGGGSMSYLRRTVVDQKITLREARTGAVIATKSFKGQVPECPRTMTELKGVTTPGVTGGAPAEAVLKWIAATVK